MERQRYLQEFRHGLDESKFSTILQRSSSSALPKTSYHTVKAIRQLSSQEIHLPSAIDSPAVLVVENINLDWIGTLGLQLGLDPAFFVEHAFTLSVDVEPWDAIFGKWSADHRKPTQKSTARYGTAAGPGTHDHDIESRHVDGVIEFDRPRGSKRRRSEEASSGGNTLPRLSVSDEDEIWQTTTRISYCPVRANFRKSGFGSMQFVADDGSSVVPSRCAFDFGPREVIIAQSEVSVSSTPRHESRRIDATFALRTR